jgi:hypothetical protein
MNNVEFIKTQQDKHPYLSKILLNFKDVDIMDRGQIQHTFDMFHHYKHQISEFKINYAQVSSFKSLYSIFIKISGNTIVQPAVDYSQLLEIDGWYIIQSNSLEETRKHGANTWCIYQNEKWWNRYNANNKHYILVNKLDNSLKYGISMSNSEIKIFNENNKKINLHELVSSLPRVTSYLKIDVPDKFRNFMKEYWNIFFSAWSLFFFTIHQNELATSSGSFLIQGACLTLFLTLILMTIKNNLINPVFLHRHFMLIFSIGILTLINYSTPQPNALLSDLTNASISAVSVSTVAMAGAVVVAITLMYFKNITEYIIRKIN